MAIRIAPVLNFRDSTSKADDIVLAGAKYAPAISLSLIALAQIATTLFSLIASSRGVNFGGPAVTTIACISILILGVPHGAFDIKSLLAAETTGLQRITGLILYIVTGTVMAAVWWCAPVFALALFFTAAIFHFGEDWCKIDSPFLSHGAALGLLSAPTLLHGPMIAALFNDITSSTTSTALESVLTLVAPVAIAAALAASAILWFNQNREIAIAGLLAVVGLIALPPVVGFAIFFCLHHSPRHFAKALGPDARSTLNCWAMPVALTTLLALGLAVIIYWLAAFSSPSAGVVRASFISLSILTVPHMLLPRIVKLRNIAGSLPRNERNRRR